MATYPTNPYANFQMPGLLGQGGYVNPMQAGFGGAAEALAPMMGYTDRPTSIGQFLAAAGGGGMQGMQGAIGQNQQTQMGHMNMQMLKDKMSDAQTARDAGVARSAALAQHASRLGLPAGTSETVIIEAMKAEAAGAKFGTPYKTADGIFQMTQSGEVRRIGDLPPNNPMFDPDRFKKEQGYKAAWGRYEGATANVEAADSMMGDIEQMYSLVNSAGDSTGAFADAQLGFSKAARALGMDVDVSEIATLEALKAKGMDFVMKRIAETKGAISEKEMNAFAASVAGIANTPEGNKMILDFTAKLMQRVRIENEAVRAGWNENISAKELDDIKLQARADFGSLIPDAGDGMSGGALPDGVTQQEWDAFSPEERALFQ
jgi:hypothetical protein